MVSEWAKAEAATIYKHLTEQPRAKVIVEVTRTSESNLTFYYRVSLAYLDDGKHATRLGDDLPASIKVMNLTPFIAETFGYKITKHYDLRYQEFGTNRYFLVARELQRALVAHGYTDALIPDYYSSRL